MVLYSIFRARGVCRAYCCRLVNVYYIATRCDPLRLMLFIRQCCDDVIAAQAPRSVTWTLPSLAVVSVVGGELFRLANGSPFLVPAVVLQLEALTRAVFEDSRLVSAHAFFVDSIELQKQETLTVFQQFASACEATLDVSPVNWNQLQELASECSQ